MKKTRQRRNLMTLVFSVSIILIIISFREDIGTYFHHYRFNGHMQRTANQTIQLANNKSLKRVLFYTTYFGTKIGPRNGMESPWNFTTRRQCPFICMATNNKADLPYSDAVIFHEPDLLPAHVLKSIYRNPQQRWIYYTQENPYNARHDSSQYNGIFNWTMTYRTDSDLFYPYGFYGEIQSSRENDKNHIITNYAQGKDKLIVWAASHCGLLRDKIVHKMLQFLPVTVIGDCSKLFKQTSPGFCGRNNKKCSPFLRTFKFYLSFENGMCTDYITEKYWETPFDHDMVPIVLGSNYDSKVAIPGSYINIMDFPSMKALAEYIKYLDRNDTAYNEYFQWKTKFSRIDPGEKDWTCQLCTNLYNDSLPNKVYNSLGNYWGVETSCNRSLQSKIESIIN